MATLEILEGGGAEGSYELDGELVLGREEGSADVVLEDPGISRAHAAVRSDGGRITIEDLGSSNGTFVNGERISGEVELDDGDQIQLGGTVLAIGGADAATALLGAGAGAGVDPTAEHPGPAPAPRAEPASARPQRGQPSAGPSRLGPRPDDESNIPALAAVFLGPLSIILLVFTSGGAFFLSLPCAIAAIVLGNMGMRRVDRGESDSHRSLASIGRITGIVGTVLSVIALIVFVVIAAALDATEDNLSDLIDRGREEIEGTELPDAPDVDAPSDGGESGGAESP